MTPVSSLFYSINSFPKNHKIDKIPDIYTAAHQFLKEQWISPAQLSNRALRSNSTHIHAASLQTGLNSSGLS